MFDFFMYLYNYTHILMAYIKCKISYFVFELECRRVFFNYIVCYDHDIWNKCKYFFHQNCNYNNLIKPPNKQYLSGLITIKLTI